MKYMRAQKASAVLRSLDAPALLSLVKRYFSWALRMAYVYGILGLLIPTCLSIVIELYVVLPLHSAFGPTRSHTVHFVRGWTLGYLGGHILTVFFFSSANSPSTRVLRAVLGENYVRPNVALASRCVALPLAILFTIVVLVPALFGYTVASVFFADADEPERVLVYRFIYPLVLLVFAIAWLFMLSAQALKWWSGRVRDEVYLVGAKLHNYGEKGAAANEQTTSQARI